jgi:hypothetical protein
MEEFMIYVLLEFYNSQGRSEGNEGKVSNPTNFKVKMLIRRSQEYDARLQTTARWSSVVAINNLLCSLYLFEIE